MKIFSNKFFLLFIAVLLIAVFFAVKMYNKPHTNIVKAKPDYSIVAIDLTKEFTINEEVAEKKFSGKIVEVSGVIKDISFTEGKAIIILKGDETNIICHLEPSETETDKAKNLKEKQSVTIRGNCTGFLLDVMLTDCIIIDKK